MDDKNTIKVGIVAGEHSGDYLGAELIRNLKSRNINFEFYGVGGPKMMKAGFQSLFDFNILNVMGILEPLRNLRGLLNKRSQLKALFDKKEIDIFIGIDIPDFNNGLHSYFKNKSVRTIQIVSPSVWGWRQGRIKKIKKNIDLMVCLFDFENIFYKKHKQNSIHMGHPFSNLIKCSQINFEAKYNIHASKDYFAILPGSRISEIKNMMPVYLEYMKRYSKDYFFLIATINEDHKDLVKEYMQNQKIDYKIEIGASSDFLSMSEISLVASGTATLQAAILGSFPIICYKTNYFNYLILSSLLKTKFIGLPNIILNDDLFPELIQGEFNLSNIATHVSSFMQKKDILNYREILISRIKGRGIAKTLDAIIDFD